MKDLKDYRMECRKRFSEESRKTCFEEYWNLGSRDRRAAYVASLINIKPKKTAKIGPDGRHKKREYSYGYEIIVEKKATNM